MEKLPQLSDKVTQSLLHEMQEGDYAGLDTLPPEMDLALRFNVSRNIIRESLTCLEREGYIIRKHGVGTLINKSVVHVSSRLDLNPGLMQSFQENGKHGEQAYVHLGSQPATDHQAKKLHISSGDSLIRAARLFVVDGRPGVYCIDYVPEKLVVDRSYRQEEIEKSDVFDFLCRNCGGESVETCLAELRSLPPTEEVARALQIPMASGLLYLEEVGYDLRSKPVLYCEEYFIDRVVRHMIVRKKI